jgi:hypothetical protein
MSSDLKMLSDSAKRELRSAAALTRLRPHIRAESASAFPWSWDSERRTHDNSGHGTSGLFTALDVARGKVIGELAQMGEVLVPRVDPLHVGSRAAGWWDSRSPETVNS